MSVFDSLHETSNEAIERGEKLFKSSKDYYKLKLFFKVSTSASNISRYFLVGLFVFVAVMFFSVALAIFLGNVVDNRALGYVLVGALYVIIAFISYLVREKITEVILKVLSKRFFD